LDFVKNLLFLKTFFSREKDHYFTFFFACGHQSSAMLNRLSQFQPPSGKKFSIDPVFAPGIF
jgi:hypothetical protein